jgi:hypothetical protein
LGLLVAHQQEVAVYICNKWHVLYWKEDCLIWLEYQHVIIKCETDSCYLNLLKGTGKLSTFVCKYLDTHTIYSCYLNLLKDIGKLSTFIHKYLDTHTT